MKHTSFTVFIALILSFFLTSVDAWGGTKISSTEVYSFYTTSNLAYSDILDNASLPTYISSSVANAMNGSGCSSSVTSPIDFSAEIVSSTKYYRLKVGSGKGFTLTAVSNLKEVHWFGNGSSSSRTVTATVKKEDNSVLGSVQETFPNTPATIVDHTLDISGITGYDAAANYTITITTNGDVSLWAMSLVPNTPADRYTFHYGVKDGGDPYTVVDFVKQGLEHEWQVENFVMPETYNANMACYVGWNGYWYYSNLSKGDAHGNDKSVDLYFKDMQISKLMQQGCEKKGLGWNSTNAHGAIGTLRIFDNYNENNQFIGFIPNGFGIVYGVEGGSPWTMLAFDEEYDTDKHRTAVFDVADDKTAGDVKYYVGIAKNGGGYVFCGISETKFMAGAGKLMGTTTSGRGCFRIDEHSCGSNFGCEFVGTHRIIYHANYPVGVSPADTYSEDVMQDENITLHLASAPTAPSGYTFAGWNASADGTYNAGERLAAGGEYIMNHPTADVDLYAQWEEDESPCFEMTIKSSPSGSIGKGANLTSSQADITTGAAVTNLRNGSFSGFEGSDLKFGSGADSLRITLPADVTFQEGTVITFTAAKTGEFANGKGIKILTPEEIVIKASGAQSSIEYTVPAGSELIDAESFSITRASGSNTYLHSISISNCASVCRKPEITVTDKITYTVGDVAVALSAIVTRSSEDAVWYSNTTASTSGATNLGTTAPTPATAVVGKTYYYCTATNACGTTTSDFIEVVVQEAPCFEIKALGAPDGTIAKDASLNGSLVSVTGGTATFVRKDGTGLTVDDQNGIKLGSNKDSIRIVLPVGSCLGIGTIITAKLQTSSNGAGLAVYTTNPSNAIQLVNSGNGVFEVSYEIKVGDPWLDANILYLMRATGSSAYIQKLTITNCGTPCTEAVPVISTTDETTKCPEASVTMTCTGADAGATLQWYKGGVAIVSETGSSYTTTEPGEYTCIATNACSRTSNPITIINKDMAMVHSVYSSYYIKQNRVSPPIPLFEVPGVSSWSITPTIAGCTYEKDGDIIYLKGVPTGITTDRDETLTLTYDLGCGSSTATMLLHELAETAEPTVAYIVVGTKNGDFTEGVRTEQSTDHPLYQYIDDNGYALTACNEYSTVDEKAIVEYYSQYDIVLITDYPSTKEKNSAGKSYGNALGVLVDKVPVLSLETFLSGNSNWSKIGLSANPHTPQDAGGENDDQFTMDLLCPAHDIFGGDIHKTDNKINVITPFGSDDGDKNTTGLQGFTSMEAPDGFIFIATIDGGKHGTLVTCCERQTVVEARLLLFGVNYYGSEFMTIDGKLAVKQMLDYLLKKEKSMVADCAEVFDNGKNNGGGTRQTTIGGITYNSGDNLWNNPANWTDAHLPNALKAVLVEQPCIVDVPSAHASSIKLCKGTNEKGIACDGKLTIRPEGGLSVSSSIVKVNGTDHVNTYAIAASDLIIEADALHQGALALGTKGQGTPATVQYYSRAVQSATASTWQYMGVPFTEMNNAVDYFRGAWMCEWLEGIPAGAAGANWAYVANEDVLNPFQGYAITQPGEKTYTHTGMLLSADTRVVDLSFTTIAGNEYKGNNLVANSWMAPIRVKDFEASDFHNANATIYIYNTGSYTDWDANGDGAAGINETTTAGQYVSLPVAAVGAWDISTFREIPPMQGFFVQATASDASLTMDFSKLVYSGETLTNKPQRAPRRASALRTPVKVMVGGSRLSDEVYILPDADYSMDFENGLDGRKMVGDERAPMLAYTVGADDYSVAAVPSLDSALLTFRKGEDVQYTLTFSGMSEGYQLLDRVAQRAVAITEGMTYTFTALSDEPEARFLIVRQPDTLDPGLATGWEDAAQTTDCQSQATTMELYDSGGRLLYRGRPIDPRRLMGTVPGVYMVSFRSAQGVSIQKVIF